MRCHMTGGACRIVARLRLQVWMAGEEGRALRERRRVTRNCSQHLYSRSRKSKKAVLDHQRRLSDDRHPVLRDVERLKRCIDATNERILYWKHTKICASFNDGADDTLELPLRNAEHVSKPPAPHGDLTMRTDLSLKGDPWPREIEARRRRRASPPPEQISPVQAWFGST
jgi:hypothetical protein